MIYSNGKFATPITHGHVHTPDNVAADVTFRHDVYLPLKCIGMVIIFLISVKSIKYIKGKCILR